MSNNTMQAVQYYQFGGPEVLQLQQAPRPEPQADEMLIRVHAAGVLPIDWKIRKGLLPIPVQFPNIPGTALAGVVEAVGQGVTAFQIGQEVYGRSTNGTYAEYTTAPAEALALKPQSLSFDEAASLSGGATTAWQAMIQDGGLQPGERVLIHGAAGGVGLFAVQFAKWRGAHVTATCGSDNVNFVRSLGADIVIDYTSTPFEEVVQDVDLVLDTVGGGTLERSWSVVRRGGTLISIAGQPSMERAQELGIRVLRPGPSTSKELEAIAHLIDEGKIRAYIGHIFSLNKVGEAHEQSQSGHGRGRIVLHIAD